MVVKSTLDSLLLGTKRASDLKIYPSLLYVKDYPNEHLGDLLADAQNYQQFGLTLKAVTS